jgi:glycogen operon protein
MLLFNGHQEPLTYTMPAESFGKRWRVVIDTSSELGEHASEIDAGATIEVPGRAVIVMAA